MSEGLKSIKHQLEAGKKISPDLLNLVTINALIDIFEKLDKLEPIITFYKVSLWILTSISASVIVLVFGIITGQIVLTFK